MGLGLKLTLKYFDTKLLHFLQSLTALKLSLVMLGDVVSTLVMGLATTRGAVAVTARMMLVNFMVTKLLLSKRFFDLFAEWAVGSCEIQEFESRSDMEERRGTWWRGRRFDMSREILHEQVRARDNTSRKVGVSPVTAAQMSGSQSIKQCMYALS